ncbi:MAG: tryptophan--tRNA ligase [Candidatus Marinimicrobia bacterium]|nr:tryptophan--tRNA ligase [Candidatus Neomarinimicrobiota bacterium]
MLDRKIILSGIQPSGNLCLGNYIGALKNWESLQDEYDSIFLVVDMHALTSTQSPSNLRNRCLSFVAQYVACGIDPEKSIIAIQSHIHEHAELMWVLNSICYIGELNRMTQFKDKSKNQKNKNVGLFTYPVLMASDILLYQADLVPVGADQKQHLELSRNLAVRFNNKYSETFKVPEPFIPKVGSRIMSLQDPLKKMSKSDENLNNIISLLDTDNDIRKKISRAVTDSGSEIKYLKEKPGLSNLIDIYASLTKESIKSIENNYQGKMYSVLKKDLIEIIINNLSPIRSEYNKIIKDKTYLNDLLKKGSDNASYRARKTLSKVYRKVGFVKK